MIESSKVSVIMPTFNRSYVLRDAIDSALAQTDCNLEIIVVDDGSTDHTSEIVANYATTRKVHYSYQQNRGVSAARNCGIRIASGEFIAFLDSDDIWLPNKLSLQLNEFRKNAKLGILYGYAEFKNIKTGKSLIKPDSISLNFQEFINKHTVLPTSTVIVRKSYLDDVGYFDENLGIFEDLELWIRLARISKVGFIDKILAICRINDDNISSDILNIHMNFVTLYDIIISRYSAELLSKDPYIEQMIHAYRAGRLLMLRGRNSEALKFFSKGWKTFFTVITPERFKERLDILFRIVACAGIVRWRNLSKGEKPR